MSTFFWTPGIDLIVPTVETSFLMHRDDSGLCQAHRVGVLKHPHQLYKATQGMGFPIDCGAHMGVYSILLLNVLTKCFL